MVACADFVKSMLVMGMSEHEKRIREEIRELKIEAEEAKAEEEKRTSELASLNAQEYSQDFTDDDMESALVLLFGAGRM
jgi:cytochrome P450